MKRFFTSIAVLTILISVGGCQSARKALNLDTSAVIHFEAGDSLNPDSDGRSSPVVIHVFKLSDNRAFARQDFLSLYEGASSRLGKELIGSIELKELTPGEKRSELIELTADIKYLGFMAEFIDYQNADSLLNVAVMGHNENGYYIRLENNEMTLSQPPEVVDEPFRLSHKKYLKHLGGVQ